MFTKLVIFISGVFVGISLGMIDILESGYEIILMDVNGLELFIDDAFTGVVFGVLSAAIGLFLVFLPYIKRRLTKRHSMATAWLPPCRS